MVFVMGAPSFFEFHPPPILQNADVLQRQVQRARLPTRRSSSQREVNDQFSLGDRSDHADETLCQQEQRSQSPKPPLLSTTTKDWTPFHRLMRAPIQRRKADSALPARLVPSGDMTPPTVEYSIPQPSCTRRELKPQSHNLFLATHIFQECAQLLTNPFADGFDLNPIIINAARPFISRIGGQEKPQVQVLDVGYSSISRYTESIAALKHTRVYKVIPQMPTVASKAPEELKDPIYTVPISSLGALPIRSDFLDIISARTLYTDVTKLQRQSNLQGDAQSSLKSWISEFRRVLKDGGCLEYIFFDRGLSDTGPLTEKLEFLFYDQTNQLCDFSQDCVTGKQFFDILQSQGFKIEQNFSLMFPLLTLSSLVTQDGQWPKNNQWQIFLDSDAAPEIACLLGKVYEECSEMKSAWHCYIGYARKTTRKIAG